MNPRPPAQRLSVRALEQRLVEAEAVIAAMIAGKIDAVVGSLAPTPVLLAEAQAALRASEHRYRQIVETTDQGVWLIDADQKTTFMNRRMAQMLGCEPDQVLGRSPMDFVDEAGRASTAASARNAAHQAEVRYLRADGTSFWGLLEATPEFDSAGRYAGTFAMVMDITARKQAEAALRASEAQLRQVQKMEAVGRLAGGIAHDFNNLLTVILSCGEFLLETLPPDDRAREVVDEICGAGTRAAVLTRQLLLFSRQQVLAPEVLDLVTVTEDMESMLRRVLGEDVVLVLRDDGQHGRVRADPGSVEQVIMNLIVNARDAMPTGGTLTIETRSEVVDGARWVVLSVTDTGTGMDPVTQARIFEPFYTTKEVGKGTGLGLSTVFGIVQQSQGVIDVHSEPGLGTNVRIRLPEVEAAVAIEVLRPQEARSGTETILLVEDEDQVRTVARIILRRRGYRVIEMRSGPEALMYCQSGSEPIHLLVTDVVMPQVSGPELARRLFELRPGLKVLFMSGYIDDRVVSHGVLEADVAFLQKPFTSDALTRRVREVLDAPLAT